MYNIGIIGNGSGALVSILALINASKREGLPIKITCIYDPVIPTIEVGESTSSAILFLLTQVLDFRVVKNLLEIDGTLKYGTKYINWSTTNNDFYVCHIDPALHINSAKFSKWGIKKVLEKYEETFSLVKDNVKEVRNNNNRVDVIASMQTYQFDYVVDCTGFPPNQTFDEDNYSVPDLLSVNSVILLPKKGLNNPNEYYTSATAHENGWMFTIPLTTRTTSGYLYNNSITPYEQALYDFCNLKEIDISEGKNLRNFSWNPLYRKTVIDKKIIYCGNKLFFFEPSQGFSLHYYAVIIDILISKLRENPSLVENELNLFYDEAINSVQDVIALTYQANTKYKSDFWKLTKEKSRNKLMNSKPFVNWCKNRDNLTHYSSHSNEMLMSLIDGMNIDLSTFAEKV